MLYYQAREDAPSVLDALRLLVAVESGTSWVDLEVDDDFSIPVEAGNEGEQGNQGTDAPATPRMRLTAVDGPGCLSGDAIHFEILNFPPVSTTDPDHVLSIFYRRSSYGTGRIGEIMWQDITDSACLIKSGTGSDIPSELIIPRTLLTGFSPDGHGWESSVSTEPPTKDGQLVEVLLTYLRPGDDTIAVGSSVALRPID